LSSHDERPGSSTPRLALAALAIVLVVSAGWLGGARLPAFVQWIEQAGPLAPLAFIIVYAVATVAFVPGSLLTLAAGATFGLVKGLLVVLTGATLGSAAAFLVARYLARSFVERRLASYPRFAAIDRAVAAEGFKIVLLMRLSPLFPFNLTNYALGLTSVPFAQYLAASVGMLPGALLYVYYGKVVGDVAAFASGAFVSRGAGYYVVLGLGLCATLIVATVIARIAKRALEAHGESAPNNEA